jgi:hypothetical protein
VNPADDDVDVWDPSTWQALTEAGKAEKLVVSCDVLGLDDVEQDLVPPSSPVGPIGQVASVQTST